MRIKKFTGATLKEATDMMKSELGAEAIILSTRKVARGGVLNFLGREEFEITAAIDDQVVVAQTSREFEEALTEAKGAATVAASAQSTLESLQQVARHFEERAKKKLGSEPASVVETAPYRELRDEVESLRSIVQEVAVHLKHARMPALPEHLKNAYITLVAHGVDEQLAAELTQRVYRSLGEDLLESKHLVEQSVVKEMASLFKIAPEADITHKPKVVALVGPTGVGKTTTIAKLAAIQKLMKGKNVALITADTYRIGAIEQLRMFAAIANIPMQVVYEPSEMRTALARLGERDVVFLDTVGRSQRVAKEISEVADFVCAANPHEVHLVISASADDRVIKEAVENFRAVSPNRMIFSKLDEAVAYGQLVNVAHQSGLPVSYVTTGQNVPDDIVLANNMQLAGMVFTGEMTNA